MAETFLEQQIHPTVIISAYWLALDDIVEAARKIRWIIVGWLVKILWPFTS